MSSEFGQQQFQRTQFRHKPSDMVTPVNRDTVKAAIKIPASGLAITGFISLAGVLGGVIWFFNYSQTNETEVKEYWSEQIFGKEPEETSVLRPDTKAEELRRERKAARDQAAFTIVSGLIAVGGLLLGALYMFFTIAGIMMMQLKKYRMCKIACVVAMVPVLSPLVVLGIPFGAWGLKRLMERDTTRAFLT